MSSVCIEGISRSFPSPKPNIPPLLVLDNVSFEVKDREFCSVLGHSGCGKTTLLNMLAGFEYPTSGNLLVNNLPVDKPTWRRSVVFQDYALFPWMTVRGNIAFGLQMKRAPQSVLEEKVAQQVKLVGLGGFEDHYPHQLSGGMKQRVSIARALAVDPDVLLMDEPFAALDAQNRSIMQEEMGRIIASSDHRERKTMILVTHSIEEAIMLSDRIIILGRRPGRVKANLTVDLPRPRSEEDPKFVSLRQKIRTLMHEDRAPLGHQ